jgi:hypothetical protein
MVIVAVYSLIDMSSERAEEEEVELVSESGEEVKRETGRIVSELSRYLESEYHSAIFSDANFVPAHLVAREEELKMQLKDEIARQVQLTEELNDAEFTLKEL